MASAPPLRFGICGLGFAGAVLMAPAMKRHPHARIVAAREPKEDVRRGFGAEYDIPTYTTLSEMIDGGGLGSEVPALVGQGAYGQGDTIDELVAAIRNGTPVLRDADWGVDTVRMCRAILDSSASGEQVPLAPLS